MHPVDWRERWREGRIGFHRPEVNRHLRRHLPDLVGENDRDVLVPLCGKSVDLVWLREQGHRVTGVELAPEAVAAFLDEQGLSEGGRATPPSPDRPFHTRSFPGLTLHTGDIFDLVDGDFDLIWDRAALIALPPHVRPRYAQHLVDRLSPGGTILLVTLEYDPAHLSGPPFSVPEEEVHRLFAGRSIVRLSAEKRDRSELEGPLAALPRLEERVHTITV